jgi:MYXO-CTERM domain-containing protein
MAFIRGWWVVVLLAPVAILAGGQAMAADGALPHGIHLSKSGRYYRDVCDRDMGRHCYSSLLLPRGFTPQATPDKPSQNFCTNTQQPGGTAAIPDGAMGPTEVLTAYSIPTSASANGKIVAIVDMPDTNALADLNTYRAGFPGMSALPQCTGGLPDGKTPCFAAVDQDGNANPTVTDCPAADPETSLDMDMISAACPDCSILFVEMTKVDLTAGPLDSDFLSSVATAAKLGAVATSISFGGPEELQGSKDTIGYTTSGHLVLAASGDEGYLLEAEKGAGTSPSYPASAPDVLGVGGTLLQGVAGGAFSETVWNDQTGAAGSGCSIEFDMPSFQTTFGATKFGASCTKRASADVSAAADYLPANPSGTQGGIAEYDSYNKWVQVAGTSAAAPMVAAILVRLGLAEAVSNNLGFVYTNIASFNDVTSGTNGVSTQTTQTLCPVDDIICNAAAGWDGPTGVGTPNGTKLALLGSGNPIVDAGSSSGGSGSSGGEDSGTVDEDSGAFTVVDDAGNNDNGFGTSPTTASCSCTAPGSSAPLENTGAIAALGALALFGARRRRR